MTTPANASDAYKDQIRAIVGGWRDVQVEEVSVNTPSITFTVPATAKMARIQGVINSPSAAVITPGITFNGNTTAIYNSVRIDTTNVGDSAPVNVTAGTKFQFTSSFGSFEQCLVDIMVPIKNDVTRQLFKSTGFNNGGVNGDYHTCVGWAASALDISTIELFTVAPFANGLEAGSFFTMSVLE